MLRSKRSLRKILHIYSPNSHQTILHPSATARRRQVMPSPERKPQGHPSQGSQERSTESADIILVTATVHMACWLLVGSIGWATSPQPLRDDPKIVVLILLWFAQVATAGCLLEMTAPSLTVSSTAAIIGATMVALFRTVVTSTGNGAVWSFWVSAGAYAGLGVEAWLGLVLMARDNIAYRISRNAATGQTLD